LFVKLYKYAVAWLGLMATEASNHNTRTYIMIFKKKLQLLHFILF